MRLKAEGYLCAIVLSVTLALTAHGCGSTESKLQADVREARALLAHPAPGDPEWDKRAALFAAHADEDAPRKAAGQ